MTYAEGNVGLAFGLVIGAGIATCIGSCAVFCTTLANSRFLAGCLGLSSGVMLYVSFAEIFCAKSIAAFEEHYADHPDSAGKALRMATFCFFSGMVFIAALNALVQILEGLTDHTFASLFSPKPPAQLDAENDAEAATGGADKRRTGEADDNSTSAKGSIVLSVAAEGSSHPPIRCMDISECPNDIKKENVEAPSSELAIPDSVREVMERDTLHAGLNKMGLMSGLAIAIHNFPEGLATFVAALAEPKAGAALAIATALHNIPEGICVAMPVYYSTGSKLKGFLWSFLSGVTEPIGGLVAYFILWNSVTPLTYAIMFGMVGGMMVYISLRDLLPTALRYDPEDRVTTLCLFLGMGVMAASLLIFTV